MNQTRFKKKIEVMNEILDVIRLVVGRRWKIILTEITVTGQQIAKFRKIKRH